MNIFDLHYAPANKFWDISRHKIVSKTPGFQHTPPYSLEVWRSTEAYEERLKDGTRFDILVVNDSNPQFVESFRYHDALVAQCILNDILTRWDIIEVIT